MPELPLFITDFLKMQLIDCLRDRKLVRRTFETCIVGQTVKGFDFVIAQPVVHSLRVRCTGSLIQGSFDNMSANHHGQMLAN